MTLHNITSPFLVMKIYKKNPLVKITTPMTPLPPTRSFSDASLTVFAPNIMHITAPNIMHIAAPYNMYAFYCNRFCKIFHHSIKTTNCTYRQSKITLNITCDLRDLLEESKVLKFYL